MKQRYRVQLPICVGDRTYQHGETIELDLPTATAYAHALIALPAATTTTETPKEEEENHGGNS